MGYPYLGKLPSRLQPIDGKSHDDQFLYMEADQRHPHTVPALTRTLDGTIARAGSGVRVLGKLLPNSARKAFVEITTLVVEQNHLT